MTTWKDFAERAGREEGWLIRDGEAMWVKEEPAFAAHVYIALPPNTLDPHRKRIALSQGDEDVEFETCFFKEGPVNFHEARLFTSAWVELWGEPPVWVHLTDSPPPGFQRPKTLDFDPRQYEVFDKLQISNTAMAPVWGQPRSYFKEQVWELNSWGRENFEPGIKWQQSWVRRNLICPFCSHTEWNLTYAMRLREPEEWVFDRYKHHYGILCPKCERCVEVVSRKLVD